MPVENEVLRSFSRELPVDLNDHELQMYGKMLAEKIQEEQRLEEKRKQTSAEYGTKIKAVRVEMNRLAEARNKGQELRQVPCIERFRGGVVEIVRGDKNEVVDVRPADGRDLQTTIPGTDDDGEARPDAKVIDFNTGPRGGELGDDDAKREREPALHVLDGGLRVDGDPSRGEIVGSSTGANVYHQPDDADPDAPPPVRLDLEDGEVVEPIDDAPSGDVLGDQDRPSPLDEFTIDMPAAEVVDRADDANAIEGGSPWADEAYAQRKMDEASAENAAMDATRPPPARKRTAKPKASNVDHLPRSTPPTKPSGGKKKRK